MENEGALREPAASEIDATLAQDAPDVLPEARRRRHDCLELGSSLAYVLMGRQLAGLQPLGEALLLAEKRSLELGPRLSGNRRLASGLGRRRALRDGRVSSSAPVQVSSSSLLEPILGMHADEPGKTNGPHRGPARQQI
jgi:hypothetical protein